MSLVCLLGLSEEIGVHFQPQVDKATHHTPSMSGHSNTVLRRLSLLTSQAEFNILRPYEGQNVSGTYMRPAHKAETM